MGLDETIPIYIYALLVYAKNVKTDMNPEEKRVVTALAAELKKAWKEKL